MRDSVRDYFNNKAILLVHLKKPYVCNVSSKACYNTWNVRNFRNVYHSNIILQMLFTSIATRLVYI